MNNNAKIAKQLINIAKDLTADYISPLGKLNSEDQDVLQGIQNLKKFEKAKDYARKKLKRVQRQIGGDINVDFSIKFINQKEQNKFNLKQKSEKLQSQILSYKNMLSDIFNQQLSQQKELTDLKNEMIVKAEEYKKDFKLFNELKKQIKQGKEQIAGLGNDIQEKKKVIGQINLLIKQYNELLPKVKQQYQYGVQLKAKIDTLKSKVDTFKFDAVIKRNGIEQQIVQKENDLKDNNKLNFEYILQFNPIGKYELNGKPVQTKKNFLNIKGSFDIMSGEISLYVDDKNHPFTWGGLLTQINLTVGQGFTESSIYDGIYKNIQSFVTLTQQDYKGFVRVASTRLERKLIAGIYNVLNKFLEFGK